MNNQGDGLSFILSMDNEEAIQQFLSIKQEGPRLLYLTALEMGQEQVQLGSQRAAEILRLLETDGRTQDLVFQTRKFGASLKTLPKSKARRRF